MIVALQVAHQSGTSELHDPLEDDPDLQPIFEDVQLQARQEVDREYGQRMVELQNTSPKVADFVPQPEGTLPSTMACDETDFARKVWH